MINRSRSLRCGYFLTGGIRTTPACTVSESTETLSYSEPTADIKHITHLLYIALTNAQQWTGKPVKFVDVFERCEGNESYRFLRNVSRVEKGRSV